MRDLSKAQFDAAIKKYGFKATGFMGYYHLPEPYSNLSVCSLNGGETRRSRLAYLVQQLTKEELRQP